MKLPLALLAFLMPNIVLAMPHNSQLDEFSSYQEVHLHLSDNVSGGCWTNLKEVREYAEEKIKMSGMNLNADGTHQFTFAISAVGSRDSVGLCQGNVTVGLYSSIPLPNDVLGLLTIKELVITFGSRSLNSNILDAVGRFFRKLE
jgi:hypothetical protein